MLYILYIYEADRDLWKGSEPRESSRLDMNSRLNPAMKGERDRVKERRGRGDQAMERNQEYMVKMAGLSRTELESRKSVKLFI